MNICVYGASSNNIDKIYINDGERLGEVMAQNEHTLIFGGGQTGLMGAVVRGVTKLGGKSIGIAPTFFDIPGILFEECTEFIFTDTMRERKDLMEKKADAFIMTPGGIGTMEEFFEIYTLKQLKQHNKPIGILNTEGYYDDLINMLRNTANKGFLAHECLDLFVVSDDPEILLQLLVTS